jgi:hypothetical protein
VSVYACTDVKYTATREWYEMASAARQWDEMILLAEPSELQYDNESRKSSASIVQQLRISPLICTCKVLASALNTRRINVVAVFTGRSVERISIIRVHTHSTMSSLTVPNWRHRDQ